MSTHNHPTPSSWHDPQLSRPPRRKPKDGAPQLKNKKKARRGVVELESGWSMVTSSPLRMQSEVEGKKSESQGQGQSHEDGGAARGGGPEKAVKGLMGEVLRGEFERMRGQWRAGEVGRRVVDGVVAALMFGEDIVGDEDDIVEGSGSSKRNRKRRRKGRLDKAVGIAMGSFSGERGDRTRCLWQLVAFVEVVDALSKALSTPIPAYAQDPRFNALDEELLVSLDITPTTSASSPSCSTEDNNDAQTPFITPHTFLYAPFLQWEVLLPVFLRSADPLLYIGNDVEAAVRQVEMASGFLDGHSQEGNNRNNNDDLGTDEVSEEKNVQAKRGDERRKEYVAIGERFLRGRTRSLLGRLTELHGLAFEGLVVYCRSDDEEDEEGKEEAGEGLELEKLKI